MICSRPRRASRAVLRPLRSLLSPPPLPLQVWPQLGLLWAGIAKLEHLAERPHRALPAAQAAARILAATHGGAGPAAEAVARVALEAQHELAHMRQRGQADEDA